MGACATKPKDLKDDAPEPIPEVVKEETSSNPEQLKKTDGVEEITTTKEIIGEVNSKDGDAEDNKGDDGNKTVSLNSLLMESEPGKATVESEKPTTETVSIPSVPVIDAVKLEEIPKVEASVESSNTSSTETEKQTESAPVVETVKPRIVEAKEEPLKDEPVAVVAVQEPLKDVEVKGDVAVSK